MVYEIKEKLLNIFITIEMKYKNILFENTTWRVKNNCMTAKI